MVNKAPKFCTLVTLKETKLNLGSGVRTGGGINGGVCIELDSWDKFGRELGNCGIATASSATEALLKDAEEEDGVEIMDVNAADTINEKDEKVDQLKIRYILPNSS